MDTLQDQSSHDGEGNNLEGDMAYLNMQDDVVQIDESYVDGNDSGFTTNMILSASSATNDSDGDAAPLDSIWDMETSNDPNSSSNLTQILRKSQRTVKRTDKILREELKFMNDFDPSKRTEQKKKKRYIIDALGRPQILAHNLDSCDCLIPDCVGCHFPCRRCGDARCGHECRQNRRWIYESIEVDGRDGTGKERRNSNFTHD